MSKTVSKQEWSLTRARSFIIFWMNDAMFQYIALKDLIKPQERKQFGNMHTNLQNPILW